MKRVKLFALMCAALTSVGCSLDNPSDDPNTETVSNTVIVYMIADNNLSSYAKSNINDMEAAFNEELGAKVLIFYNQSGGTSQLLDVVKDETTTIASTVLKTYEDGLNPCLPATLSQVIEDCRTISPTETYSMIFWSHATGWLPYGMSPAYIEAQTTVDSPDYTFGSSNTYSGEALEIYELAAALPDDLVFEYIYFDACHMGSIEVAYELKDRTKYFMGSAAEILAAGFPYSAAMDDILTNNVVGMAEKFYEYYFAQSGSYQSATISVTQTDKLEAVAAELKSLASCGANPTASQQYGRYLRTTSDYRNLMWDIEDMATRTYGDDADAFLAALDEAVIYKAATPYLFMGDGNGTIVVAVFGGLSIYIPQLDEPVTLDIYTNNYQWAKDTEFYLQAY